MSHANKTISANEWFETKILLGKLLSRGRYEEARELMKLTFLVAPNRAVENMVGGMQFVLDILHPPKEKTK